MVLVPETKKSLIDKYKRHETDTGSPEVQIAILSERIGYLTEHLKTNKKDHHTRYGLLRLVRRRQKLLNYLRHVDVKRYENLINKVGIRG